MSGRIPKFLSVVLCAAMLCAFSAGCTENAATSSVGDDNSNSGLITELQPMRDVSSMELIKEIKVGWSLGNTLDAGYSDLSGAAAETIERSWGNPVTTKAMIDEVVNAGFNLIRIPVTWEWSTGAAPDYTISDEWMDRVQEVVDYAVANDVFVILNIHHETWHYPTEDNYEAASDRLVKVWTQIGNRFENYNEKLIFEGLNEPRVIGTSEEWNGGSDATREVVNKLNADFVETIRSLGGNNSKRHLMIPGYAASATTAALKAIRVPQNDDKIIVSVHAYYPNNFALADSGSAKWFAVKSACVADIDRLCTDLKEIFMDKGQAVIIGEFGARSRDNEAYRAEWVKYYITRMNTIGVPCVWWDNGAVFGNGELFGFLNRRTLEWYFPDMLNALMDAVDGKYTVEELLETPVIFEDQ